MAIGPRAGLTILFSAYAEVFPVRAVIFRLRRAFLCLRRGVSRHVVLDLRLIVFSLPTQRCFSISSHSAAGLPLFSAYAEVFL